jgi:serine/threonine protein phosphatase 1
MRPWDRAANSTLEHYNPSLARHTDSTNKLAMPPRLIALGDIHGCAAALDALLAEIQPQAEDCLVFLGDYVDRGPDSRGVLERVLDLRQQCRVVPLIGNHELMMLDAFEDHSQALFWLQCGGAETLASYGNSPQNVPAEHLDFLRQMPFFHETEQYFFVHANYDPQLPLPNQSRQLLCWLHLHVRLPPPHVSGKLAVVGHTPQKNGEVFQCEHLICLDTYCVGDGWLTAMELPSGRVWQADKSGALRGESTTSGPTPNS